MPKNTHDDSGDGSRRSDDKKRVTDLMARIVEGDDAAFFTLVLEFNSRVAYNVLQIVTDMGRRDILADADEMSGLVTEAWLVVRERAGGWSPDGAMPWRWAHLAIRHRVSEAVGHRSSPLMEADGVEDAAWSPTDDGGDLILTRLRCDDARLPLMLTTLKDNLSERDYLVVVEYLQQKGLGDPSPSHTVGRIYALRPDNVRQIYRRARKRMQGLVDDVPGLESLRDFWWLAA
ncbi:MAG: hypothetical protein H8E59_06765 [Actinobacteria bacterium]|nr:hypothetical protein [Actinomycetota bacterium]